MTEKWHNRILYWALATVPLGFLIVIDIVLGSTWMVFYLLFYIFLYRPLIDTQRLISLNIIDERDAWKFFVPLQIDKTRYTRNLWLD